MTCGLLDSGQHPLSRMHVQAWPPTTEYVWILFDTGGGGPVVFPVLARGQLRTPHRKHSVQFGGEEWLSLSQSDQE